jgi:hypothetical protein
LSQILNFMGQVNPAWDSAVQKSFALKSVWFASCSPLKLKGKEDDSCRTSKLKNGTMAIFPEKNSHRSVILIPMGTSVAVVGGDVERHIRPEDLRYGVGLDRVP